MFNDKSYLLRIITKALARNDGVCRYASAESRITPRNRLIRPTKYNLLHLPYHQDMAGVFYRTLYIFTRKIVKFQKMYMVQ